MKRTATAMMAAIAGFVAGGAVVGTLQAQQTDIRRELLLRGDMSTPAAGMPVREAVIGTAEIPAGMQASRHYHEGEEIGYVLQGEATFELEGEATRTVKAGQAFFVPAGKVHGARVVGSQPVKVVSVYIVPKGRPLSHPAP